MSEFNAQDILQEVERSGIDLGDDRIVGIYVEAGLGIGPLPQVNFAGGEGVLFIGVDRQTNDIVITEYGGAIVGPSISFGPGAFVGGGGVFGFDGPPDSMQGFSIGAQGNAIIGGGFAYSVLSDEPGRLQFYGGNNTAGLVVNAGGALKQTINGEVEFVAKSSELRQEWNIWHSAKSINIEAVLEAFSNLGLGDCFLATTPIALPDGSTYPIEQIRPGDVVLSYNASGALVPARVTRTFQKQVKHILDFHGTMVTPGHVYYCSEGTFAGQHVPLIDILRSDGGIQTGEGVNLRASTKAEIGSPLDQMIAVVAGERMSDGQAQVAEEGHIRLGTRYILEDGHDISIAELIAAAGGRVTEDGLIAPDGAEPAPFHWPFSATLPKPEDYVLQRSALTLNEIYQVSEWEQPPRMPTPVMGDLGPVEPVSETVLQAMPPNVPPALEGGDRAPRMNAAQKGAHQTKRRRKARGSGGVTRH